jgi:phospholipid/cholesterol/gamma-HCH transport system substrate-binding protein
MKLPDKRTTSATIKLAIFCVITAVATALLAATIGNITLDRKFSYKAIFSDVTGLNKGDDIRIAGVRIGQVDEIEVHDTRYARVTFSIDADQVLEESTHATIRYRNLAGNRYIALTEGTGSKDRLHHNATIPLAQTAPALDLGVLFNGFKPLFAALSPNDVNTFANEVIKILQGEGGTVESLLARTASLTTTLADKDKVIGDLISNLTDLLQVVSDRQQNFSALLINLQKFVSGLSQDIQPILDTLGNINALNTKTAGLLHQGRAPLKQDLDRLRTLSTTLNDTQAIWVKTLQFMPTKLQTLGRTATYGSWFNFYLCRFSGNVVLPAGNRVPIQYEVNSARCQNQ